MQNASCEKTAAQGVQYKGRPLEELTRVELIEALVDVASQHRESLGRRVFCTTGLTARDIENLKAAKPGEAVPIEGRLR